MSEHYPLPATAAYIWLVGDKIMVGFPPLPGNEKGHSIALPASPGAFSVLLDILRQRNTDARMATRGAPTQWNVEHDKRYHKMLQAMAAEKRTKAETTAVEKAEAASFLDDLGL